MRARPAKHRQPILSSHLACAALLVLAAGTARGDDLLGPYVGATFGKATLDVSTGLVKGFGSDKSAYQVLAGWRPIPELAAELEYVNFGHASGQTTYPNSNVTLATDASRKGLGAFGMLYLPTPIVDFYLRAGLAHLHTKAATTIVGCPKGGICPPLAAPAPVDSTDVGAAGGGGVMYRIRSFELRADYTRFSALGGSPYLVTGGVTWTF